MSPLSPSIRLVFLAALLGCSSSSPGAGGQDASSPDVHADAGTDAPSAGDTGGDDGSVEGDTCISGCSSTTVCAYPVAQGCKATGVCISNSFIGGCACGGAPRYVCDCNGHAQQLSCCYPQGYAPFPATTSTACIPEAGSDGSAEASTDAAAD